MTEEGVATLPRNTAFSTTTPGLQLAWDSVSLGALMKCPRYYEYTIVRGWQPKRKSVHLDFGIWMHSARERYYHAKTQGASHDDALDVALQYALEATWNETLNRPWASDDPNKNRLTLIRTLVWYLDEWKDDPLETVVLANGKPAVELSFAYETTYKSAQGEAFLLCGHIDRLARMNGVLYLSDLKTTKSTLDTRYAQQFTPDNQLSLYTYSAQVVYSEPVHDLILDAVQVAVTFSRFQRFPIPRPRATLDEWYEGLGVWLAQAQLYAARGVWPQNAKACFLCEFRTICAHPPATREMWLRSDFVQRVWDPLISRGEV